MVETSQADEGWGGLGVLLDRGLGVPTQVTLAPAETRLVIISAHSADYRD